MSLATEKKGQASRGILWLLFAALMLRLVLSVVYRGYNMDMDCFMGWAGKLSSEGFSSFYAGQDFHDYPPGYMYVLWCLGTLHNLFHLEYSGPVSILLMKLPSMLCDLFSAYIVYLLAEERLGKRHGLICAALYAFSPVILLNSTIWGQVDSILALLMLLVCYFIYKRKMPFAYVCFALGVLMKLQMLFLFPVVLMGIIDGVFLEDFSLKKFLVNLFSGLASIAGMVLLAMPFGLSRVISQCVSTVKYYPYASVNAYNFWSMLGMNWHEQTEKVMGMTCAAWACIFVVLILLASVFFWYRSNSDKSKYFFLGAFLTVGIFTTSVGMHERYMFYGLLLMLALYAVRPRAEILIAYLCLSVVNFLNAEDVLFHYDAATFDWKDPFSRVVGFLMVLSFAVVCHIGWKNYRREETDTAETDGVTQIAEKVSGFFGKKSGETQKSPIRPSEKPVKITKWDILIMTGITLLFFVITLHDLGDRQAPVTGWESHEANEMMTFQFPEGETISEIHYYLGNYHRPKFNVDAAAGPEGPWTSVKQNEEMVSVFKWQEITLDQPITEPYVRFTSLSSDAAIWELVFLNQEGEQILPVNQEEYAALFDEQQLYPERTTNMNSTYFDEIYHARTAYEYIRGIYSYENTHPPLGKIFISLGIRIFGMNPFGWRIAGALFGVAMLPFLYLFAKKMFRATWLATVVTLLFTFDFMHFVQTRIATIDVFITFFVILMYYFMYQYSRMSFYDTPLQKTYRPLFLCGLSMGLGIASKWTGVYAGLGLAVIFFVVLFRRYREYVYAKAHPEGSTEGIAHSDVIRRFPIYTRNTIIFCCLVFIVIPVCIYTLSYIPFRDSYPDAGLIERMLRNQKTMFDYHSKLVSEHDFSSRWYQWPIMTRPVWYYSGAVSDTLSEGISAFGNPLVWWAGIPAFVYMIYLAFAKKDRRAAFLIVGYLAQYFPWAFISRTTYMYHYFPSVPFVALMLGYSFCKFAKEKRWRKTAVFVYVAAAIGLFVIFYPVLSGHAIDKNFVIQYLRWLPGWVLVV